MIEDRNALRGRIKRLVDETDDGDSAAQAIIDDLGLRVEEVNAETKRTDENGHTWYDVDPRKMMTRIVGNWGTK